MIATKFYSALISFLLVCLMIGACTPQPQTEPSQTLLYIPEPTQQENSKTGENILTYTGTNLQPITAFSTYDTDPSSYTANVHDDNAVYHTLGQKSIRIEKHTVADTNYARECDGAWLSVVPGDHIVYGVWIKTAAFESEDAFPGARLGFDYYIDSSEGFGRAFYTGTGGSAASDWPSHPNDDDQISGEQRVAWGSDWTYVEWDVIVPATLCGYVYTDSLKPCTPIQISSVVMWFDARAVDDDASAWFADPVCYVNPTIVESSRMFTLINLMGY